METIDARKQACPKPVLMTRDLILSKQPEILQVIVDNDAAGINVSRFLESQSYTAEVEKKDGRIVITGKREGECLACKIMSEKEIKASAQGESKIMVMISSDRVGSGDDVLGEKLMVNFINTLMEMLPDLWRVVMVNSGVKLATRGSAVIETLAGLEKEGVTIFVCGTCLEHFGLSDDKLIGETTNMLDIVTSMQLADKVISI